MSGDEECVKVDPTHPAFINIDYNWKVVSACLLGSDWISRFPIGSEKIVLGGLSEDQLSEGRRELYIFRSVEYQRTARLSAGNILW